MHLGKETETVMLGRRRPDAAESVKTGLNTFTNALLILHVLWTSTYPNLVCEMSRRKATCFSGRFKKSVCIDVELGSMIKRLLIENMHVSGTLPTDKSAIVFSDSS